MYFDRPSRPIRHPPNFHLPAIQLPTGRPTETTTRNYHSRTKYYHQLQANRKIRKTTQPQQWTGMTWMRLRQDPNQLAIPALRQALTTFGIRLEEGEYRSKLFQRYVKLARIESPESVERWIELDSLDAPLPAAEQLVVSKLRIILALHSVDYPAQASRGHLVKLYNALANELNPSGSVVDVSTLLPPSRSDPKKKKKNSEATGKEPLPPPTPPPPTDARFPTYAGKTRRTKSAAREDTFFQPYRSSARPARSSVCHTSRKSAVCPSSRTSQAASSSGRYSLRRSPRLRAAQEESDPPSQSSDARDQTSVSVKEESDDDDESQTPTHVNRSPSPTRSPTRGPSPSEAVDGHLASDAGDSERTASEAPSEPPSQSFDGRHPSETSSDPRSQSVDGHHAPEAGDSERTASEAPSDPRYAGDSERTASEAPSDPRYAGDSERTASEAPSEPPSQSFDGRHPSEASSDPRSQSVDGHHAPEAGDSERTASEAPSDPRYAGDSERTASEAPSDPRYAGDSERTASEAPSEPPSQSFDGRHPSEASSDPRSQSVDGHHASEAGDSERTASEAPSDPRYTGDSERTASEAPSEPPSQSFDGRHPSEASSDPRSQSEDDEDDASETPTSHSPAVAAPLQAHDSQPHLASRAAPTPPPTLARRSQALKRKSEDTSEWPDHSQLSREQITEYLDQHNVAYNSTTRTARLIGSYNLLRSGLSNLGKRPRASQSRSRSTSRASQSRSRSTSRLPSSRPRPSSARRNQCRVESSEPKDNDCGFVYSRPGPPSSPRNEASSSGPASSRANSPSSALSSNYQPSVASTESLEAPISRASLSARSTSTSRDFPTKNTGQKRAKKNDAPIQARKKPGRPRAQQSLRPGRRQWRRPSSTHHEDINFVAVLPDGSKKRRRQHDDLSSSAGRMKRIRPGPDDTPRPQASRSRSTRKRPARQNSYTPPPSGNHRPALDRFASPPAHRPQASTSDLQYSSQPAHPDHSSSPPINPYTSGSRSRRHRHRIISDDENSDDELEANGAARRKRKQPHHPLSSPPHAKRQAAPVLRRIPTNAEVRRRRQRQQNAEDRARRNSVQIHPTFRDDEEVIMPSDPSGVQGWRSSLPRDFSGLSGSEPSSPSGPAPPPDQTHSGLVASCCSGQQLVSQLTQATGILTEALEQVNLSQLRPSSSGEPSSSSGPRPSGSGEPRNLTLLARVRLHIKTLFGKCMALNQFPPPATDRERANWKNEDFDNDDSDDESTASSVASYVDPAFPYPNGPGHKKASPATLSIMWRTMRRAGVVSFRPDLARGPRDTDNAFLWDLAHTIFMKLVRAQEYLDIDLENCSTEKIHDAIYAHAKQIHRTYREAAWNPQRLDQRAIMKRRLARTHRLRDMRVKFLTSRAGLVPLIPVVTHCTSDADTDEEGSEESEGSDTNTNGQRQKRVVVKHLPWRHPRIGRAFKLIDKLITLKRESGCKKYGKSTCTRVQPRRQKISQRSCPKSLPSDAICDEWLQGQRPRQINALSIQSLPALRPVIRELERMT
ncbi:hypothetical protein PtA15_3A182 [Puccinia triticina]|uniref:Uncharacterized protein n=1 Tax=Puccinia triticina TaxID=208348 RepID=A0ABY7CD22_9BASI|nr:uncharacterized protein PtA15_3A182 [Puccinia triticina]WAQ82818.1 hypothetical protein PtA15_3A182 [Puccinia triticina]